MVAGEAGICTGCGVATLSISYYDLGYITGEMAAKILTGEADVSTMPIAVCPHRHQDVQRRQLRSAGHHRARRL